MEVAVIQSLARRLTAMLRTRDPLSQSVHLKKAGFARVAVTGLAGGFYGRLARSFAPLSRSYRA